MNNDPFQVFKPAKKKKTNRRSDSLIEQLRDIGESTAKSFKNDFIKGTGKGIYEQILNSRLPGSDDQNNDFDYEKYIRQKEEDARLRGQEEQRHFDRTKKEFVVFSLRDEKVRQEINQVRQELAALKETMGQVEQELEQAIIEEVVNPGLYHLSFFQKLRQALELARKTLSDGSLWTQMWSSRSNRSHYWKMANSKGTKYSLSQERTLATQTG